MRSLIAAFSFFFAIATGYAQQQENKLIDRLLRPKTELRNNAQNKKFAADRASVNKKADLRTFYVPKKREPREFVGTRDFSSWQFSARSWSRGKRQANTASRNAMVSSQKRYPLRAAVGPRSAPDADRIASSRRDFSGKRPFLGKGKSQKVLSQHDTPLTIEQVRELLNKNK